MGFITSYHSVPVEDQQRWDDQEHPTESYAGSLRESSRQVSILVADLRG